MTVKNWPTDTGCEHWNVYRKTLNVIISRFNLWEEKGKRVYPKTLVKLIDNRIIFFSGEDSGQCYIKELSKMKEKIEAHYKLLPSTV